MAWSQARAVRRFGFVGVGSIISKWRLIYKQQERQEGACGVVWDAMQNRDWKTVLELLGAFGEHEKYIFRTDYETRLNKYDEEYKVPSLLLCINKETGAAFSLEYRPIDWEIISNEDVSKEEDFYFAEVALMDSLPSCTNYVRSVA